MPLLIVALGIVVLLLLIIFLRLNSFLALVLVALGVGMAQGMPIEAAAKSMQAGVGDTLGSLALILGFGAMLGALLAAALAYAMCSGRWYCRDLSLGCRCFTRWLSS
jgi:H+/gluconate symporter-like permease